LLADLNQGRISEDEAYSIYERVIQSDHGGRAFELLGLSKMEWTAFMQSTGFAVLAEWRRTGWPTVCSKCGRPLDHAAGGWWFTMESGVAGLKHIQCP